jgi:ribosomal protein S2
MTTIIQQSANRSISTNEGSIFSKQQNKNLKKLKLKIGDTTIVTINALGSKNIGLAEVANGYTVLVPKSKLGETVKVQIEKISIKPKYAIGKIVELIKETNTTVPIKVDDVLNITIDKQGPNGSGLHLWNEKFTIIVQPSSTSLSFKVGDKATIRIIRLKEKYAFGYVMDNNVQKQTLKPLSSTSLASELRRANEFRNVLTNGSYFTINLPKDAKCLANYAVIKMKNSLVFIKLSLGVQLGERVRIQIVKTTSQYAIAKITKLSPTPKKTKQILVKNTLKRMISSGMHYGEKAIRCHAEMRKFLWIRKRGKNQNRPLMKRGRHIINILKTRTCLNQALLQLAKYAAKGKTFLFIGTKKPAASLIARTAMLSKTSYFVNTRWLGGMLTNWKTILKSISQIRPILKEKQKMIQKILEKRQKIKQRLLKKVNLLRRKSEKLLMKGKELLSKIKQDKNVMFNRTQILLTKKLEISSKLENLLQKYRSLELQKQKLIIQTNSLQEKGNLLIKQKKNLTEELQRSQQKLEEFKQLHEITQMISSIKNEMQEKGKTVWAIPFENTLNLNSSMDTSLVPNPSTEILNRIVNLMKLKYDKNLLSVENNTKITTNLDGLNRSKSTEKSNVVVSQLLNKLTDYLPFIQTYIQALVHRINTLQEICKKVDENINTVQQKLKRINSSDLQSKVDSSLILIKSKIDLEKMNLKLLKRKLKQLAAEQKLLKFLPKLRYLPTSKKKMAETVEFLMKKFVDPKMSYSMDQVYDQKLKFTSKKLAATRKQKWQRLEKYFGGITKMAKMKRKQIANNVVILIGQQEEMNAVRECRKLGMKMFTVVDTNCNPRFSDYVIPANDDSRNSIKLILGEILTYIRLGQKLRKKILSKHNSKNSV